MLDYLFLINPNSLLLTGWIGIQVLRTFLKDNIYGKISILYRNEKSGGYYTR
jgi:hypothetical protein